MPGGAARVWMDVTTSWRARGGSAGGTLRVERSYASRLAPILGERLRFCRYDGTRRRMVPLAAMPALVEVKPGAGRPPQTGEPRLGADVSWGRRLERAFRTWRREALGRILRHVQGDGPLLPGAGPGDILLMVGENWSHHDFDVIAALRRRQDVRLAVLCQDMIPEVCPQFFERGDFVERFRAYAEFLIRDADLVIAISRSTRDDIVAFAEPRGGVTGRLATIQLGADFVARGEEAQPVTSAGLTPGAFVISVSTIQLRKNFDLLHRLWHRLSAERHPNLPRLVIVGQRGFGSGELLERIAGDPVVRDTIVILHEAGDAELAWLYRHCLFTLYPSYYEGWGLPVSESLAYGKVCLASDTSSLPESGQGLVRHLDPGDLDAWHCAVVELIDSKDKLAALEARIAQDFTPVTWAQSAQCLADELDRL